MAGNPEKSTPPNGEFEGGAEPKRFQQHRSRNFAVGQDRVEKIKARFNLRGMIHEFGVVVPERDDVKFSSLFRADRTPSMTIHGEVLKDWSQNKSWDLIDFYAEMRGIPLGQSIAELFARVSRDKAEAVVLPRCFRKVDGEHRDPHSTTQADAEFRQKRREKWVHCLRPLTEWEIQILAITRGLSLESVHRAAAGKHLLGLDSPYGPAWVLVNDALTTAQARLIGGKPWPDASNAKAKTLPGSVAANPIIGNLKDHHAIALVEGAPDFIATFHHAICAGIEDRVCPVAMLGSSLRIPDHDLMLLAGRRVRIFIHDDVAGSSAAARWARQLQDVDCSVDGFDFSGLHQLDGKPVTDLNDLCRVHPDAWEANHDLIENAFRFAAEDA